MGFLDVVRGEVWKKVSPETSDTHVFSTISICAPWLQKSCSHDSVLHPSREISRSFVLEMVVGYPNHTGS